jgi:threonylcarbamoyladenosine tRNA methylthiotransferase MtaB
MALNSLKLLDDCDIVAAHIFPFSPRPGTPAERMPQLPREVVKARAARLRDAAAERRSRWLDSLVGTRQRVLIESPAGTGHSGAFAPVTVAGTQRGEIVEARIAGRDGDHLAGAIA